MPPPRARRKFVVRGDEIEPFDERRQHGGVVRAARWIEEDLATRVVWQGLDTTGIMLARGSITEAMKKAADRFHAFFQRSGMDALRGADLTRVPMNFVGADLDGHHDSEAARLQILSAIAALGGIKSPGGSCAWHVLGLEESLSAWAMRASWATRRIDHRAAAGILIADLGILRLHWGL